MHRKGEEESVVFQINDYIVYGGIGVCKVNKIGTLTIGGIDKAKSYYTLEPLYSKGSIVYTPINNSKVIMRKVLSKDEACKLIDDIPNIQTKSVTDDKNCEEIYKEALKKYDCCEWIKTIKMLYLRKQDRITQGKKMSNTDESYLSMAEDCLYGELAIPLEIPKDKVVDYITARTKLLEFRLSI